MAIENTGAGRTPAVESVSTFGMSCTPAAYRIGCSGGDATSTTLGILPKQPDDIMLHLQPVSIALTTTSFSSNPGLITDCNSRSHKRQDLVAEHLSMQVMQERHAGLVCNVELAQTVCGKVRLVSDAPECWCHCSETRRTHPAILLDYMVNLNEASWHGRSRFLAVDLATNKETAARHTKHRGRLLRSVTANLVNLNVTSFTCTKDDAFLGETEYFMR